MLLNLDIPDKQIIEIDKNETWGNIDNVQNKNVLNEKNQIY